MSDRKKIIGIVIITILILVVGMSVGDSTPKIRATYQVVEGAQLSVNVEGVEEGDELSLYYSDDDKRVGTVNISSDDITKRFIGIVQTTVEISMVDEGNPEEGNYSFVVKDSPDGDTIYEEELTFEGPEIEIIDIELETEYHNDRDEWEITGIKAEIENEGDLPIFTDKMNLTIDGCTEEITFDGEGELMPDKTTEIIENLSIVKEVGTHSLNLELYSYGEKIRTYETEVTIG